MQPEYTRVTQVAYFKIKVFSQQVPHKIIQHCAWQFQLASSLVILTPLIFFRPGGNSVGDKSGNWHLLLFVRALQAATHHHVAASEPTHQHFLLHTLARVGAKNEAARTFCGLYRFCVLVFVADRCGL